MTPTLQFSAFRSYICMLETEKAAPERRLLLEIINIFSRRWKIVSGLLILAAFGAFIQHLLLPKFVAKGSLIIRTDSNSPLLRVFGKITGTQSDMYGNQSVPSDEMMKILKANEFSRYIGQRVRVQLANKTLPLKILFPIQRASHKIDPEITAGHIISSYNLKQFEDVIVIYGYSADAETAEAIAKWVTGVAQQYLIEYETKEVQETEKYLRSEIEQTSARLASLNEEVDKFRNDPNISRSSTDGYAGDVDRSIARIREELEMVLVRSREIEILDKSYKSRISANNRAPDSEEAQADLLYSRGRVVDNIKDLAVQSEQLQAKERALTSRLASLVASLKPQNEQAVFDLKRQLDLEHALRQELQRQVYATRIYQISAQNKIRLYESVLPGSAFRSITLMKTFGLAIFFALFFALVAIVIWEQLYPVMSLKQDFLHNGVRFLGSLPILFQPKSLFAYPRQNKSMFSRMASVLQSGMRMPESTAVQFLAARILHNLEKQKNVRSGILCVISCNSGEGKTLISNCLSVAFGSFGTKVLLVEGDTLRSKGENIFGIGPDIGFAEILGQTATLESAVKQTEFKNVSYLCRGMYRPDISLLQSEVYYEFLQRAREVYDVVLVDTPAFTVGPEALFMASQSDLSLVVAAAHQTKQEDFIDLAESLHSRGMKNLYAILNRSGHRASTAEAYYYTDKVPNSEGKAA